MQIILYKNNVEIMTITADKIDIRTSDEEDQDDGSVFMIEPSDDGGILVDGEIPMFLVLQSDTCIVLRQ